MKLLNTPKRLGFLFLTLVGMLGTSAFAQSTPGLRAYWNDNARTASKLGQVDWEIYDSVSIIDDINFPRSRDAFYSGGPVDYFAVRIVGQVDIPADGIWSLRIESDQGVRLWIDGELLVNEGASHSYRSHTAITTLTAGLHDIEVRFWEGWSDAGLVLYWDGPSLGGEEIIPASAFSYPAEEPAYDAGGDGLWAYWFDSVRHASNVGQIDWNRADLVATVQRPSYRTTRGGFRVDGPTDYFAVKFVGIINTPDAGVWTFELGSDQSGILFIDGTAVISDPTGHSYRWKTGAIDLAAGDHTIEIRYWEGWADAALFVAWKGPNDAHTQIIPSSAYRPGSGATNPPSSGGLRAYRYDNARYASGVGDIDWADHDSTETVQNVYWPISRGAFFTNGPSDYHATRLVGKINFPRAGTWTIGIGSDQSVRMYLGGQMAIDDSSSHGYRWKYGTGSAPAGEMDIEIQHWEGWSDSGLVLTWKGPGDEYESVIPSSALSINETDPALGVGGDGLRVYWVDSARHASKVGHIDWQNYDRMTYEANLAWEITRSAFPGTTITNDEGTSTSFGGLSTDYFGLRAVGLIDIPSDGEWKFNLGADQSAQLFIDGQMLINDDISHGYRWKSGTIELTSGVHEFEVRYWEGWSDAGLNVTWTPPGGAEVIIPPSAFSHPDIETDYDSGGGGLRAYWTTSARYASSFGQINYAEHSHATTVPNVYWPITRDPFDNNTPSDYYGLRVLGQVDVPATGTWTFSLGSDQSAILLIDGEEVIVDPVSHGYRWQSGSVALTEGKHDIEVRYWEGWSDAGLALAWRGPTVESDIIIPRTAYSLQDTEAPFETGGGVRAYWTASARHARNAGQIDYAEHSSTTIVDNVAWSITRDPFYLGGPSDYFGLRLISELSIPETGDWVFNVGADQSVILLIDDEPIVVDTVSHGYRWVPGTVSLTEGVHKFEVRYWEGWSDAGLNVTWKGPSDSYEEIIPASAFNAYDPDPVYDAGEAAITAKWYNNARGYTLDTLDWDTPSLSTTEPRINWNITRDPFATGVSTDYFALKATGTLIVPSGGTWTFGLGSDQYARLVINGQTVVNDPSSHGYRWINGDIDLAAGEYDLELYYMDGWSDAGVFLTWQGPGDLFETVIPASAFVPKPNRARVVQWKEIGGDHNR